MHTASAEDGRKTGDRTGVGLFIPLPPELANQFPQKAEDKSPPHITFLYVGNVPEEREEEFLAICNRTLGNFGPVQANLSGFSEFINQKDQKIPHIEIGFSRDMAALRRRLRRELMDAGFEVADKFLGYKPHSTLAYMDDDTEVYDGPVPEGSFTVDGIEVWGLPKFQNIGFSTRLKAASRTASDDLKDVSTAFDVVTVLTTTPVGLAQDLVWVLVGERHAACGTVHPGATGTYWWEGKLKQGDEEVVCLKTIRSKVPALRERLNELHPYDIPQFLVHGADLELSDPHYLQWVVNEAKQERQEAPRVARAVRTATLNNKVGSAVCLVQDGRVLLLRRSVDAGWMPGTWNFPGGGVKIKKNESVLCGGIRECVEEAGIVPHVKAYLGAAASKKTMHVWLATSYTGEVTLNDEHDVFEWVPAHMLRYYDMVPHQRRFAQMALGLTS